MEKIRALVMKPGKQPEMTWINNDIESVRHIVGGDVNISSPLTDGTVIISKQAAVWMEAPDHMIRNSRGEIVERYSGTIIAAGYFAKSKELDSLTDDEMAVIMRRIETPVPKAQ